MTTPEDDAPQKKVLFVAESLNTSGGASFLTDLVIRLIARNVACVVVSLAGKGPLAERLEAAGCEVVGPVAFWDLRRLIRAKKPDVVHGWTTRASLWATLAAIGLRKPLVWSLHQPLRSFTKRSLREHVDLFFLHLFSDMPRAIHYTSTPIAEQYEKYGFNAAPSFVLSPGIDCVRFAPNPGLRAAARAQMGLESLPDAPVVGHIARFHPTRDHITFLCAAAFLISKVPEARFVLMGKGVDEKNETLTSLRETLGLKGHAYFLGERVNVDALLNGMDLVSTSSSQSETFPLVLAEAMATGVPCVATDTGDCGLLLGPTGILVPPRDGDILGQAWLKVLSEPAEARKERRDRARKRVMEGFEIEGVADKFLSLYDGLK